MRLLHTSDWHLGQTLHHYDRTHEHQHFLDWLLDTLDTEATDLLLVAGDIFDTANPSAAAQRQLYRFLTEARRRRPHLAIVMIAGNHDSPARLEAPAPFLDWFGAACVGQVHRLPDGTIDIGRLVVPVRDADGQIAAWCLAIPFLRPSDVPRVDGAGSDADGEDARPNDADPYQAGVAALYRAALEHALARREPGQPIVALGHCHMREGEVSEDSERRIVIGGAEALPAGIFDPAIAYVALGHLHRPQRVGRHEHIRYSGSPLPMSFSEIHYPHQVVSARLDGEMLAEWHAIPVPRPVDLMRVPPTPRPIEQALDALRALDLPSLPDHRQPYLQVRVVLDGPEPTLRAKIEAALDGKPVRLARIEVSAAAAAGDTGAPMLSLDDLNRLDPAAVFASLYRERHGAEAPATLAAALAELLHAPDEVAAP
ncbi:exonuclease SbcCD subunit D C-terminal domain-containing protein [Cupriavidus gilardii]|uniref:exonuclease SbcCD subunit D C-terminal domain-containing protein n=1 Tax=Cupriavidus gilardii TaxID=82541 RepID=UPI001573B4B5|nr:exonuclease SbcCD subunit D C-terminal domain-containing protein [Cupriavidus gilardii]NSX05447.1 exonuclease SbcCD subunit D C-terminal domain-containing protein [Cupriavidus gilardii]